MVAIGEYREASSSLAIDGSKTCRSPHKGTESHQKNKYLFRILPTLLCCSGWIHRQEGNREKASRKPQWKNYDFTMFLSRITTSRCIAVDWYLRVYWLLPLSTVDSCKKHRRFFRRAPTTLLLSTMNTWASQSTSFPKGFISRLLRTLFLFINWISRQLDRIHTESADTCQQDPPVFVDKTVISDMLNSGDLLGRAKICACYLENGHQWDGVSSLTGTLQERKR